MYIQISFKKLENIKSEFIDVSVSDKIDKISDFKGSNIISRDHWILINRIVIESYFIAIRIILNGTNVDLPKCKAIGSTEYYWYYDFLQISSTIENNTGISWQLVLSLFGVYALITICMIKGIESAGKVRLITFLSWD